MVNFSDIGSYYAQSVELAVDRTKILGVAIWFDSLI